MPKSSEITDEEGKATHIRTVSDDGRRSDLYEYRGKRVETAFHYEDGTTTAYEADDSLLGLVCGSRGRGREKPVKPVAQKVEIAQVEEACEDEPTISSEEFLEAFKSVIYEIREEQEREKEGDHEREMRELYKILTHEADEKTAEDRKRRVVHIDSLDRLYALSESELGKIANYANPNKEEMRQAMLLQTVRKIDEKEFILYSYCFQDIVNGKKEPQDDCAYFIVRRIKDAKKKKERETEQRLERLLALPKDERRTFVNNNPSDPITWRLEARIEKEEEQERPTIFEMVMNDIIRLFFK